MLWPPEPNGLSGTTFSQSLSFAKMRHFSPLGVPTMNEREGGCGGSPQTLARSGVYGFTFGVTRTSVGGFRPFFFFGFFFFFAM